MAATMAPEEIFAYFGEQPHISLHVINDMQKKFLLENGIVLVTLETLLFEPVFDQIKSRWPSEIYMLFYVNIEHKLHFVYKNYEVVSIPIAGKNV